MFYLSVCAIHKMEHPHLLEWIEYHRLVGVEHFYLADNNDDSWEADKLLRRYVAAGVVTTLHMPGRCMQLAAYNTFLPIIDSLWAAFIDLDEFLLPMEGGTAAEMLTHFEKFGGLVANWSCFGSSGREERPTSVLQDLQHRAFDDFAPNQHIKSIVQPSTVVTFRNPHFPYFKKRSISVNEDCEPVHGAFQLPRQRRVRINHYILRSRTNFRERAERGRADQMDNPFNENYWNIYDRNEVFDDHIWATFGSGMTKYL